jgi:ribosomal protein S18 acetylase RimI-like enzyme
MIDHLTLLWVRAIEPLVDLNLAEQCREYERTLVDNGTKLLGRHFGTSVSQLKYTSEVWNCATAAGWDNLRRSRGQDVLLYIDDKTVVGMLLYTRNVTKPISSYDLSENRELGQRTWYIDSIFVHPKYRRKGICSALIQRLQADAKNVQMSYLEIQNDTSNYIADSIYTKAGFRFLEADLVWTPSYFGAWSSKLGHYSSADECQYSRRSFGTAVKDQVSYDARICPFIGSEVASKTVEAYKGYPMFNWNKGQITGALCRNNRITDVAFIEAFHVSRTILLTKKVNVLKAGLTDLANWAHKEFGYNHFEISTVDEDLCEMLTKVGFDFYYKTRILRI